MTRALLLVAMLAGCEPVPEVWLYGMTSAPPSGRATIHNDDRNEGFAIELSTGVAIAAYCTNNCDEACIPRVTVADAAVLDVRPVYRINAGRGQLALIAKQPGSTSLLVEDACGGSRAYDVKITPP